MNEFWEKNLPAGYYDKILTNGLKEGKGIQASWHNTTFCEVRKYILKDEKHLDYACGPGTFIGNYNLKNSTGMDISDKQIEYAKNKYPTTGKFQIIDYEKIKHEKYDVITIIGLLEFIDNEEIESTLDMLYNLLNKNGKLIITTPNYTISMYLLEKLLNLLGPINYKNQHINRFKVKSLYELLKKTQFQDIKIKKITNFTIFFSFVSFKLSDNLNVFLNRLALNKFGFILLASLKKS